MHRCALLLLAWIWPAAVAAQPDAPPVFGDTVEVTVVNVTVTVSDREGNPVTGLDRGAFELWEDGKRVKITHFAELGRPGDAAPAAPPRETATAPATPPPDGDDTSFVVLYLDQIHTAPHHRNRVVDQMAAFVRQRAGRGDWLTVVSYDRDLRVVSPPTTDAGPVLAALDRLAAEATGARSEAERRGVMRHLTEIYRAALERRVGGGPCADKDLMISIVDGYAAQVQGEVSAALRALGELTTSLGGLRGRKALIYLSDGLPLSPGEELYWLIEEWCPVGIGPDSLPSTSAGARATTFSVGELLEGLARQANRNGVTVHALQTAGLPTASANDVETGEWFLSATPRVDFMQRTNDQATLTAMADATGGRAFLDTNDAAASLAALGRDLDHAYELGYTPKRKPDRRDHRIEVKVKRKGLRVRHRTGHRDLSRHEQVANRTLAALWYRLDFNPLGATVALGSPGRRDDGHFVLPVVLEIPLAMLQLVPHDGRLAGQLSLFFAREQPDGRKPPASRSVVPLRLDPERYLAEVGSNYLHGVKLLLEEGRQRLAIGIFDEVGGGYSVLYREVELADGLPARPATPP